MATTAPIHTNQGGYSRLSINQLGIWMFFLSETFLFGGLISTRFYLQGFETPEHVDQVLGLGITIILLFSSFSAYRAEAAVANGDHKGFQLNLLITILLGAVFIGGVGYEWFEAYKHFPPHTGYGTVFFTITGIHATHVLSGVIMLTLIYFLGRKRERWGPEQGYWGVESSIKYWHFVDVAWFFIYPTLYLLG
jgi:cytochrome c oxidase subunit 3